MIKLDQNLEERKKLENGINNRLGAALLLLNNTIHEQGDIYDLRSDERKVIFILYGTHIRLLLFRQRRLKLKKS